MNRICTGVALAAAVGLASAGHSLPADAASMELTLIEHADTDKVTDTGEKGDSVGDIMTFNNEVFENGKSAGRDNGWCVRTVVGKAWECSWTVMLSDGQIVVQGPFMDTGDSVLTVIGGTGVFEGAHGELRVHPRDEKGTEYDFVFRLRRLEL
jgi:allene oxide cyclase